MSRKGETRMFVQSKEMEKLAVIAVIAVLLFGGCSVLCSDLSLASAEGDESEAEAEVKQIDPVEITVDGEKVKVDAFEYLGVQYAVTSDRESEEEVGVCGVNSGFSGSVYIVVCSFAFGEEDEEITYSVTNVLTEFNSSDVKNKDLVLADTILDFGKGCFSNITSGTIYVSDDVEDDQIKVDYIGYGDVMKIGDATVPSVNFSYDKGDISYPQSKYKDQTMDDQKIIEGITTQFSECSFENPYYDFDGWLKDGEVVAGDCDSVTYYDGKIYINGEEYASATDMAFTATWVESDYDEDHKNFGDYPLSYMYITSAIIIFLFIIGFAMLGYRMHTARKA